MNIRPKKILYAETGVLFSLDNLGGANWRQLVFSKYKLHLLDQLTKYGEADDYGYWINDMLSRHANLYKLAGNNWLNIAYKNNLVGLYQLDYRGGLNNNNEYNRFGILLNSDDKYDFNQTGILPNQNSRYNINVPPSRTSGDFSRKGHNFDIDNLYSAITDDRRILGRKTKDVDDWGDISEYNAFQTELNKRGWEMYLDENDSYYKLRRLPLKQDPYKDWYLNPQNEFKFNYPEPSKNTPPSELVVTAPITRGGDVTGEATGQPGGNGTSRITADGGDKEPSTWLLIGGGLQKIFGNPNLLGFGRLAGTLINNEKIYGEALKGINPVLKLSYHTHRQVVGDEATKLAYYRRAAQGLTRAAQAFTSDADRQMAYLMEAKRVGDELRAQGDLADNQEIRRTSDESNQHQWANTQRDTEVANYNIESLIKADAARHNLLSLKHAAQWSSIDNYLKTIETRRRLKLEEFDALRDLEFTLNELDYIYSDTYQNEYNKYETAKKKALDSNGLFLSTSSDEYKDYLRAKDRWTRFLQRYRKEQLERLKQYRINGAIPDVSLYDWSWVDALKSGGKVTRKKKDDLLYKSTRDVVEHFRRMSKLSSDALNRRGPKIERLAEHPKGKTKKYLYGGVAPFTVWTPAVSGGETSYESSRSSSKSSGKSEKNEGLDLLKELFKLLNTEGLPSDTNIMYAQMMQFLSEKNQFGNDISIDDVATMYVSMLNRISNIKFNKLQFDNALKIIDAKNAAGEFAVDSSGRVAVLNRETGKIEYKLPDALEKGDIPLTNNDLLQHRSFNSNLAFDLGTILSVASNATSMSEISKFLKENLPKIEKTVTEMYSTQDAKIIKDGLELLKDAPEGIYKIKNTNQIKQAEHALNYILGVLPPLMSKFLNVKAQLTGQDPKQMIVGLLSSNILALMEEGIEFDAVTGKASKNENDSNNVVPAIAFFLGLGEKHRFTIADKTSDGININAVSAPITKNGHNTGKITLNDLYSSDYGGLLSDYAIMGDSLISENGKNNVIIGERIYQAELPIDLKAKQSGIIKPDFSFLKKIEVVDKILKDKGLDKSNPKDLDEINKVYRSLNLPIIYTSDGNGKPTLTQDYARFAIVNGYATESAFDEDAVFNDGIIEVDGKEEDLFESMMKAISKDNKYSLDDDLYKGTIYIPMVNSTISALGGTGYKASGLEYNLIEALQQAADSAREMRFNPAGDASNLGI